ncbi:hypothetical protein [Nonomuraea sp. NPDC049725]|uniref:hypothetical protein n=1 Tax=Nonomuraea sp. NPDC049725 TaxID=3154508 RepID=UPI00341A32EF
MHTSKTLKEQQHAYTQRLLASLCKHLAERGIASVLVITQDGRPALDVTDTYCRTRRVFVHLSFCWFYWGDRNDERVSFLEMADAVDRIEEAAEEGWHEGEQGDLSINLDSILDTYRG